MLTPSCTRLNPPDSPMGALAGRRLQREQKRRCSRKRIILGVSFIKHDSAGGNLSAEVITAALRAWQAHPSRFLEEIHDLLFLFQRHLLRR